MTDPSDTSRSSRRNWIRWLFPLAVVLVWLAVGGATGPYAGQLSDVQTNEGSAFLPDESEATRVLEIQRQFNRSALVPAVAVFEYDRAVDDSDLAAVESSSAELTGIDGVAAEPSRPVASPDGRAIQTIVQIDPAAGPEISEVVAEVRETLDVPDAVSYVTGPAGFAADLSEAFGEIDGLLLQVALTAVLIILLVVYRSPLLPFVVLASAVLGLGAASAVIYALADGGTITLNGQSQGILFILVVGAATDYALLLVSRFREELRDHKSRFAAMHAAVRGAWSAILASGLTVILGVLCLLVSTLNSNRSLGPVAAIGIAFSVLTALTFLPAALALLGRAAFWPFRPHYGSAHPERGGLWGRIGGLIERRPRRVWIVTALVLAAFAAFVPRLDADGVAQRDLFLTEVEAVTGQDVLAEHFPAGSGSPVIVVAPVDRAAQARAIVAESEGVVSAAVQTEADGGGPPDEDAEPAVVDGRVLVNGILNEAPDGAAARDTVAQLRTALDAVGEDVLVGGDTAVQLDTNEASARDRNVIIPLVLVVIFIVLAFLLRALVAPAILLVANVLSFAATMGIAALVFEFVFGFPGIDPAVPLYGFIFLVALGIDYSIFLMTRVREEALVRGTRPGIVRGLSVTGGVITSAGIVLAATFSALSVVPIAFLVQIAFIVAFGVLLDTFVVRSLLVPALSYDVDERTWWPSRIRASVGGARDATGGHGDKTGVNVTATAPPGPARDARQNGGRMP